MDVQTYILLTQNSGHDSGPLRIEPDDTWLVAACLTVLAALAWLLMNNL